MSTIAPFRALRFAVAAPGELAQRLAPPYDVISPERRRILAADPHNIVHLDLPEGPAERIYADAAARLEAWRRDGTLALDAAPAYHLAEQSFKDASGTARRRRGFFARLRVEPFEAGSVLPHERTLESPRRDRERLLAATRTHLSAVFLLHEDPGGTVARLLASASETAPERELVDPDGCGLRLWRLADRGAINRLTAAAGRGWTLIADGHHRYESALAYRQERRAAGRDDAADVLAFLCSAEDPGLVIGPIHRLVRGVPRLDPERVASALTGRFAVDRRPREGLAAALREAAASPGVFGLLFPGRSEALLLRWRDDEEGRRALQGLPEPLRSLDVVLLHRLVFEEAFGLSPQAQAGGDHLEYVKDEAGLLRGVEQAVCGVMLNPTRLAQVVEVSKSGLRLPPKSTYFQPKVPSGIVLDPLDAPAD